MNTALPPPRRSNPFATRYTRPGVVDPHTPQGKTQDIPSLLATIQAAGGSVGIQGPHGTGKSTLMRALAAELAAVGQHAGSIQIRTWSDRWTAVVLISRAGRGRTVCIDGWEQFGLGMARFARLLAWLRGCHLMVTSHGPTGLPYSIATTGTLELLTAIVAKLPDHGGLITASDLVAACEEHGENLREALCALYDRFEFRVRQQVES